MTSGRKMNLRQRPWLCLLTATLLPALVVQAASTSTSKRAIKGKNQTQRRRLQPPLPDNVPSNIFADGGKAGKAGKADSYKSCKERPTPTISPAPTKSPKTKYPTISPAPSITYSPTKSPKKTKAPTVPTVSPAPTVTFSPTKYPKYCSEAPTTDAPSHSAAPSITPRPTTQSPSHSASPSRAPADTLTPTTWPNCRGIAEGTARTDSDAVNFSVGFLVVIDGDKEDTLERLERFLQENVATAMAGCSSLERRLQETADIVNVMFNVEEDAGQSGTFWMLVYVGAWFYCRMIMNTHTSPFSFLYYTVGRRRMRRSRGNGQRLPHGWRHERLWILVVGLHSRPVRRNENLARH